MSTAIQIIEKTFQDKPIPIVQMNGEKHVVAQLYGQLLEYSRNGAKFTDTISTGAWCTRMHEGKHYVWVEGEQLADLKQLFELNPRGGFSLSKHTTKLMLLTRIGFFKATTLSSKKACDAFVDWACEEVFPSIDDTGAYVAPGAQLTPPIVAMPSALPEQVEFRRQLQAAFVMNKQSRQDGTISEVEAEKTTNQIIKALFNNATDLVTGKPMLTSPPSLPGSRQYPFRASGIERHYGIPESTVGKIAEALNLKSNPRYCEQRPTGFITNGRRYRTKETWYSLAGAARIIRAEVANLRSKN